MQGINRSKRYDFLNEIIHVCQKILGTCYSDMARDAAWEFLRLGRNLERADMTTRNIDAAVSAILETEKVGEAVNSHQIILLI